jgi:cystathionine beta-synthase
MLYDNILESIGDTPLVKLHRVGAELECNLYAKCEFLNPGGSVKDRIGYRMVADAEKSGRIKPGDTLIEPTSGNTGIGIAMAGAVKGYRVIITLPEKMSREKQVVLEALGAEIIRTPTEAAWDDPASHIGVAKRLEKELPNAHILDQYANPGNPLAHYDGTGQEILDDLDGKVDMVVIGAGTGGTVTGVAKKIKEKCPDCIIVAADPVGSILAGGTHVGSYKVEGIGYDFIPDVLDRDIIDTWVKTTDRESFLLARRLIREEGLLSGGSAGTAILAALKEAGKLKKGQNCVVLLADGVRNYMSKFIDDKWMEENRFFSLDFMDGSVSSLIHDKPKLLVLKHDDKIEQAISMMRERGIDQIPITTSGKLSGIVSGNTVLHNISSGEFNSRSEINSIMNRSVPTVDEATPIAALQEILEQEECAIVVNESREPVHIVTKIDLVDWLASKLSK